MFKRAFNDIEMDLLDEGVLVEYTFPGLSNRDTENLPQRVSEAVDLLVTRERLPSDEDVRALVRESTLGAELRDSEEESNPTVRVLLPHSVAVDLALYRSFHEQQPQHTTPLTQTELRILTRRSRRIRLRLVREQLRWNEILRRASVNCVICMEPVTCQAQRLVLECTHEFHRDCIIPWLDTHRACPTCRGGVNLTPRADEAHLTNTRQTRFSLRRAAALRRMQYEVESDSDMEIDDFINF